MDSSSPGLGEGSGFIVLTRKSLYNRLQQQNLPNFKSKLDFLERFVLNHDNYSEQQIKDLKHKISNLKSQLKKKWTEAHRSEKEFLKINEEWLQGTFEIPKGTEISSSQGRPTKSFDECSERTKRRKTRALRSTINKSVLVHATQNSLYNSGKRTASKVLENIMLSPKRAKKYDNAYTLQKKDNQRCLSPLNALSIFVEAGASRRQYEIFRSADKECYPSYKVIQQAKKDCYPDKQSYTVTETCAEVNLQHLMDHTAKRLVTYLEDALVNFTEEDRKQLHLMSKWGCDGSHQDQFKQKINDNFSDKNIFQSSFVPLQLLCGTRIIWQNPTPSSPRYCRPIRLRFVKESVDVTNSEIAYVEEAIKSLKPSEFKLEDNNFTVKHTMMFTMIDAKVCNAVTLTASTMRCYICGATSKQFNDLTVKNVIDVDSLSFGLSTLHARIRFFESILHLSYKLPVKKWQVRTVKDKEIVKDRKKEIQEKFRTATGLIVDVPKAGFGNTDDGNTSRRFFDDPKEAAIITGVDFQLIFRLKTILEVISSGQKIDLNTFADYTYETAKLYIKLYSWHPMTPTLHKILIHGATVVQKALLPIGLLSEEAAEARNKHFREYRQRYARKISRKACNIDVLNRLLLSSDPLVTSNRPKPKNRLTPYRKEALAMMVSADPNNMNLDTESSEESGEDLSDCEPWSSSSSV